MPYVHVICTPPHPPSLAPYTHTRHAPPSLTISPTRMLLLLMLFTCSQLLHNMHHTEAHHICCAHAIAHSWPTLSAAVHMQATPPPALCASTVPWCRIPLLCSAGHAYKTAGSPQLSRVGGWGAWCRVTPAEPGRGVGAGMGCGFP